MMVEPEVLAFRGKTLSFTGQWTFLSMGRKTGKKHQFSQMITLHGQVCISMVSFTKLSSLGGQRSGSGTRRVTDVLVLTTAPGHPGLPVF